MSPTDTPIVQIAPTPGPKVVRRLENAGDGATQDRELMNSEHTHSPTELGSNVSKVNLLAAVLSTLCILHCLAIPLLISVLALSIPFTENETVHVILVLSAAPATIWVMYRSLQRGHHGLFAVAAAIGLVLLFAGTFVPPLAQFEEPLVVAGALLLVSAHMWHWYVHRAV